MGPTMDSQPAWAMLCYNLFIMFDELNFVNIDIENVMKRELLINMF